MTEMTTTRAMMTLAGLLACAASAPAYADVIFDTGAPDPGFFGFIGFDLSPNQSVAVAFTPTADVRLDSIDVWMMSNAFDGVIFPEFKLSLVAGVEDGGLGEPGTRVLETWDLTTSAVGFDPRRETARSLGGTILSAGVQYWVVGTSDAPELENPVWVWGTGEATSAIDNALSPGWNVSGGGATPSISIGATVIPAPTSAALLAVSTVMTTRRRRT